MEFTVQTRENKGKGANRRLRAMGLTPGIIYGAKETLMVQMRADYASRFLDKVGKNIVPVELTVEGGKKPVKKHVLVQAFQKSAWGDRLLHVDFLEVDDNSEIQVEIPIKPSDDCAAVKLGAVVQTIRRTVPVTGKLKDIPSVLHLNIKDLGFGESFHVLDAEYPAGVKPVVSGRNWTILTIAGKRKGAGADEADEAAAAPAEAKAKA